MFVNRTVRCHYDLLNRFMLLAGVKLKGREVEVETNRHTILVLDVRVSFGP